MTTILITDDDEGFRTSIKQMLLLEDFEVVEAVNGTEAIERLKETKVDLLISDVLMPDVDGIELMGHVKTYYPTLKVIGMSGGGRLGDANQLESVTKVFFERFLKKPVSRQSLLDAIQAELAA